MREALLVLTLVVAACQNDHGVSVTVHTNDASVTKVRLYVGVGDSTTTDLTDDSKVTVKDAQYWTRDQGNEIDLLDVSNGQVTFNYDTSDPIPVVIAVGYDNQGQPVAAAVTDTLVPSLGRNDFLIYDLTLVAADPFSKTSSPMQVGLWSPATTDLLHASCAGIVDANKDHPYFVVLDHDQDCDGFIDGTTAECTPDTYHGTRGADASETNCLYATAASAGVGASCQLGGTPCIDDTAVTMSCQPGTACLPTSMCATNVCPTTHPKDFECAADIVAGMVDLALHAHYTCTVPLDPAGSVCPNLVLALDRPPTGGYDCMDFDIGDSTTALGNSIEQANVTFSAAHLDPARSCGAALSVSGTPTHLAPLSGLVNFTLNNQGGVAIPIVFTFVQPSGCNAAARCVLDVQTFDDASQTRCAAGWQPPTLVTVASTTTAMSDPTLTDDQKTMFFTDAETIMTSTKSMTGWTTPTALLLATTANRSPEVGGLGSANGTTLLFTAAGTTGGRVIYLATRAAVDLPFVSSTQLVDPSGTSSFTAATFAPTNPQDAIGIARVIAAGSVQSVAQGLFDIAYNKATSKIIAIVPITLVNGPSNPDKPHLTPDGLHLYFEGTDGGPATLYVASRATIDDPFTYAVQLPELSPNPSGYSGGAWVAPNGRTMYFTQINGATLQRIYMTTRANL